MYSMTFVNVQEIYPFTIDEQYCYKVKGHLWDASTEKFADFKGHLYSPFYSVP